MKTIPVTGRAQSIAGVLRQARRQDRDLLLQTPNGEQFLLSFIDEFDREVAATRANQEFMDFLAARRHEKGIPLEQVCRELGLPEPARKEELSESPWKMVPVPARAKALLNLLKQARREDLLVQDAKGQEYFLAAVHGGDAKRAADRRCDQVSAHLDRLVAQGKIRPLEVVFVPGETFRKTVSRGAKPNPRRTRVKQDRVDRTAI